MPEQIGAGLRLIGDMTARRITALLMAVLIAVPTAAGAQNIPPPPPGAPPAPPPGAETPASEPGSVAPEPVDAAVTPARLSYLHGAVSFRRPGADDWTRAALNTPLAPGDALYTGPAGTVEIQVGPQAYVRAAQETQVALDNQDADFVQVSVPLGHVALDVTQLEKGSAIEIDTPNGAFTIEQPGYYRVDVTGEWAALAVYRGGASVATASGSETPVAAGQQAVVSGTDTPRVDLRAVQALDAWDQWNQTRMTQLKPGESARHVAGSVYGTESLDRHGTWQADESYGRVWLPASVPAGWVPYSTGRWIWDSRFGWTWLDDAPWGWAPYHYGRWVFVRNRWAWAPGPIVVRPVYAPALVVFLGGRSVGRPLCWAPLGWGEPVIPWWGRPGFVGVATWSGWGGPRVVNNVVVNRTTVNVTNITVYRNVQVTNAVVGVPHERFGRGEGRPTRIAAAEVQQLRPVHGAPNVQPVAASVAPRRERGAAPPEESHRREVVGTRKPHDPTPGVRAAGLPAPAVDAPPRGTRVVVPSRRDAPGREGAPAARERERDERRPDADRERSGRQADVNREQQPQQRPTDVIRGPRGRQADVNRAPQERQPDASQPRGRQPDAGREQSPQRPADAGQPARGRQPDAGREQSPQRPADAGQPARGRQPDAGREQPQRPADAGQPPRGRQLDAGREQPAQGPAAVDQPRGRQPDAGREQPQQRSSDVGRPRGRQPDVSREQPLQRPGDAGREQPPRGRPSDTSREQQPQPQRPVDVNRAQPSQQPPPRQPDPGRAGAPGTVQRPADAPRREGDAQPRGGSGDGRDDAQREQGPRPQAPRSGQPGGRPQQGDGADDPRGRPGQRPGPSSQVPGAQRRASQHTPAAGPSAVGRPAGPAPRQSSAAQRRGNATHDAGHQQTRD